MSACAGCDPPSPAPAYPSYGCEASSTAPVLTFAGTPSTAYAEACLQNCTSGCPDNGPANDPNATVSLNLNVSSSATVTLGGSIQEKLGGGPVPAEITSTLEASVASQGGFACATEQTMGLGDDNSCKWKKVYMSQQIKTGIGYSLTTTVSHCGYPAGGGSGCRVCFTSTSTVLGKVCCGQLSQGALSYGSCSNGANSPCPTGPPAP